MLGGLQVMKHFSANLWSYFTKKIYYGINISMYSSLSK